MLERTLIDVNEKKAWIVFKNNEGEKSTVYKFRLGLDEVKPTNLHEEQYNKSCFYQVNENIQTRVMEHLANEANR